MVRASCALCSSNLTSWPRLIGALQRLHEHTPALTHLPIPNMDTVDAWAASAIGHHEQWRALVKSYTGSPQAAEHGLPNPVAPAAPDDQVLGGEL
eukprot:2062604-Amphidinium_carterae.1